jgi:Uma2 family endonuclease
MVVCGSPQFAGDQGDTLLTPTAIIEVLSDSTSDYDRGRKFQHYRTLPSLAECLTIAQDTPRLERWTRQPGNGWLFSEFSDLGLVVCFR